MGNTSSTESRLASVDDMEKSDATGRSVVKSNELRRALRDKGLCIPESDLEKVLANKRGNIVDALTYAIASGMTRKRAKTPKCGQIPRSSSSSSSGGGGGKMPQENRRPPLAPSLSATSSKKGNQKRSRSGESEISSAQQQTPSTMAGSRGERPSKRPAIMKGFMSGGGGGGGAAGASPLGSVGAQAIKREYADSTDRAESAVGGARMDEDTGGVLTVLQQGSPPRQRLGRSRDVLALKRPGGSSSAAADKSHIGLAQVPEKLETGKIDRDMMKAVERWAERSPEQKDAAVRHVITGLGLDALGAERKERLDEALAPCIHDAMEDLAQSTDVQTGAMEISRRVREARQIGHAHAVSVIGQYRELYGNGGSNANSASGGGGGGGGGDRGRSRGGSGSGVRLVGARMETDDDRDDRSLSPIGSRLGSRFSLFSPTSPNRPACSPAPSDPRAGGRSIQRPRQQQQQQQQSSRRIDSRSPSNDSKGATPRQTAGPVFGSFLTLAAAAAAVRRPTPPPSPGRDDAGRIRTAAAAAVAAPQRKEYREDKALTSAWDVCKASLKKATYTRKEGEWLRRQLDGVKKRAAELRRDNLETLEEHQGKVKTTTEELEAAKDSIEEATKDACAPHMESSTTMEEALRSLINSLPQQSQVPSGGCDPLEARRRAIAVKEEAAARLDKHRMRLMLVTHTTNISLVLFDEMFGDLIDRISRVQQQAHERTATLQQSLKSTTKEFMDKFKGAMDFYTIRKDSADKRVNECNEQMNYHARFYGNNSNDYRTMQASLYEMTNYSADSAERMADLRGSIKLICSSIALELSEEDMDSLTQGIKQFLAAPDTTAVLTEQPAEATPDGQA